VTARLLDGKTLAETIRGELAVEAERLFARTSVRPCLATILVGDDPASHVYIRNKRAACEKIGITSRHLPLAADVSAARLLTEIERLNADREVHGILVQLPLPEHLPTQAVLDAIDPRKDVDAFHPTNVGLLSQGRPRFLPCTPHGCVQLLHRNGIEIAGKHVVVVGRSDIVGKPLASMLIQKHSTVGPNAADATVTLCHSRTRDLTQLTRQADILIAAIGRPEFIRAAMVRPGAVVVDVGINRIDRGLVGDVAFDEVAEIASAITPVPGGVGPLTVTMLLANTLTAAREIIGEVA